MIAGGIDLGGTKIEAQLFRADWSLAARRRIDTPKTYDDLLTAMADQISWIEAQAKAIPIGVAAAGLVNPATGLALTANLPAMGQPFPADIAAKAGREITYVNDCRALTLSEAVFGAAQGFSPAIGLIIGTGIGGGVAVNGQLLAGQAALGGEFGHFALAAGPVVAHGLPVIRCGCGRLGCTETLISGPGLSRIVRHKTGRDLTPPQIATLRKTEPDIAECWEIWRDLVVEMLMALCLTIDPACIVLGGGLSKIDGVIPDLTTALARAQLAGFRIPALRLAEGGDASGARGAAYAALQARGIHV
jgi:predicted NBD/HSP70 family sugar kinase